MTDWTETERSRLDALWKAPGKPDAGTHRLRGPCPNCHHPDAVDATWPITFVVPGGVGGVGDAAGSDGVDAVDGVDGLDVVGGADEAGGDRATASETDADDDIPQVRVRCRCSGSHPDAVTDRGCGRDGYIDEPTAGSDA